MKLKKCLELIEKRSIGFAIGFILGLIVCGTAMLIMLITPLTDRDGLIYNSGLKDGVKGNFTIKTTYTIHKKEDGE